MILWSNYNIVLSSEPLNNVNTEENEKLATRLEVTKVISRHETTTTIEKVVIDSKFKEEMLKKIKQLIDEVFTKDETCTEKALY